MAASDDDSSKSLEDTAMKLPPFTEIKADGHFRYRRRVPKKLVALLGKERLYRNLGKTYDSALRNWPAAHQEIEPLFSNTAVVAEKQSEREKVLLLVANHFGTEAAELLATGQIDETRYNNKPSTQGIRKFSFHFISLIIVTHRWYCHGI